jgi:hypothetical protein
MAATPAVGVEAFEGLEASRHVDVEPRVQVSEASGLTCRYCKNVQATGLVCERCGMRLPRVGALVPVGQAEGEGRCRACGVVVTPGERCRECGAR